MLQSLFFHGLSVCCPFFSGLLLEASHVKRLVVPSYGIFSSRLSVQSLLVQCLIIRGYCRAVSSPNFQVQTSLHSERSARWRCKLFSVDRVTDQRSAQVMNPVNKWPLQRTHAREKLICSWRELNPDHPVASPTFYLQTTGCPNSSIFVCLYCFFGFRRTYTDIFVNFTFFCILFQSVSGTNYWMDMIVATKHKKEFICKETMAYAPMYCFFKQAFPFCAYGFPKPFNCMPLN